MNVFAIMVVRDEADRYLECALASLSGQVDGIVVFDDRSVDDTVAVARRFTDMVAVRDDDTPPFLQHEGQFRQASWAALDRLAQPADGDWVLSIDADELLAATDDQLGNLIRQADELGQVAADFPIREMFQTEPPALRADGYWTTIRGKRLFCWQPHAEFPDRPMASGSAPLHALATTAMMVNGCDASIIHLGYAHADDRRAKHARYVGLPGHSSRHIASILEPPMLRPWDGPSVDVWRGQRLDVELKMQERYPHE